MKKSTRQNVFSTLEAAQIEAVSRVSKKPFRVFTVVHADATVYVVSPNHIVATGYAALAAGYTAKAAKKEAPTTVEGIEAELKALKAKLKALKAAAAPAAELAPEPTPESIPA